MSDSGGSQSNLLNIIEIRVVRHNNTAAYTTHFVTGSHSTSFHTLDHHQRPIANEDTSHKCTIINFSTSQLDAFNSS